MNKKVYKNMLFALISQGTGILLSICTALILPKFLGLTEYAYWQLFIFYSTYINLLHFGISDGIYLRIGGQDYNKIDKKIIGSQFKVLFIIQTILAIGILIFSYFTQTDPNRMYVMINLCIYMLIFNSVVYIGFVFQAVNETRIYSISIMIDKLIFIVFLTVMLLLGYRDYKLFIVAYNISALIALIYVANKGKELLFQTFSGLKNTFREMYINVQVGAKLMLSAVASNFIVGSSRLVVDRYMGINEFGKLSFSFSIINFLLAFIRQVSMVLFPALRQQGKEYLGKFFDKISVSLDLIMPIVLLGYYPISIFFGMWLPKYNESIYYLKYLLPIVIFDGKAQLLFYTFMKVFREEEKLLKINVVCVIASALSSLLIIKYTSNILYVVFVLMIIICLRSIYMESFLRKKYFTSNHNIFDLTILVALFLAISSYFDTVKGILAYMLVYCIYLFIKRKEIKSIFKKIKSRY